MDMPFTFWILCFDKITYNILKNLNLEDVKLISEEEFERDDKELLSAKSTRSRIEYYWTCTPSLPLYIFCQDPTISVLYYLDADTYFFSTPLAIARELGEQSILIVPHDYSKEFENHNSSGVYNVGIMAFRNDDIGLTCLNWWRERCLEWCYWKHENGLIGDQAYLNDWPERFGKVSISLNPGINAAPWNIAKYGIEIDADQQLYVGKRPLVCYHFHGLKICTRRLIYLTGFNVALPTNKLSLIYKPYVAELLKSDAQIIKNRHSLEIPKSGIPWRYLAGRIIRKQPIKHFLLIKNGSFK